MTIEITKLGIVTFAENGDCNLVGFHFEKDVWDSEADCAVAAAKMVVERLQKNIDVLEAHLREYRKHWYTDSIRLTGSEPPVEGFEL